MKAQLLFAAASILVPTAFAQDVKMFDAKLGLWEATTTTEMEGMPSRPMPNIPPEKLAQMPPEQRARIEAMMKGGAGGPRTTTVRSCVTKESLSRGAGFAGSRDSSCTHKIVSQTATTMQIHLECTPERGPQMAGDLTVERVDGTHVKTSAVMKTSGERVMTMKMSSTSQWISDDCGDVKPVVPK